MTTPPPPAAAAPRATGGASLPPTVTPWGESVALRLLDAATCPVCGQGRLEGGCCPRCGADLRGPIGTDLWNASHAAAAAVRGRDVLLARVPRNARLVAAPSPAGARVPGAVGAAGVGVTGGVAGGVAGAAGPMGAAGVTGVPSPAGDSGPSGSVPPSAPPRGAVPASEPARSATLQSVLAIAGAGLFAIAAIVFTFFNPDLADRGMRSVVVGLVTLVFLGGAWLLARRGLQFSAEAVGGLGLVFVGLDVYAFAQLGDALGAGGPGASWLLAALTTAVAAPAVVAAGLFARIRIWVWGGLLGLAAVPAMLGYAAGSSLGTAFGHLGAAFAGAALVEALPRLAPRLVRTGGADETDRASAAAQRGTAAPLGAAAPPRTGADPIRTPADPLRTPADRLAPTAQPHGPGAPTAHPHGTDAPAAASAPRRTLEPERIALVVLQLAAVVTAVPVALFGVWMGTPTMTFTASALAVSGVFALVTAHALLATRQLIAGWWSFVAGAALVVAVTIAPNAFGLDAFSAWWTATVPAAAALAFALVAAVPLPSTARRRALAAGALTVLAGIAVLPVVFAAITGVRTVLAFLGDAAGYPVETGTEIWAMLLGLAAIAAGLALFGIRGRRRTELVPLARGTDAAALLTASIALLALTCLPLLPLAVRLGLVLAVAAGGALALRRVPRLRGTRPELHVAAGLSIHLGILTAVLVSWSDPSTAPLAGAGVLLALALAAVTVPAGLRFVHVGAGFSYALVCLGSALAQTDLGDLVVLSLVTSAGLVGAIVTTFLRRVGARAWYAVLTVTSVPFAAGILQVVFERSGWTALSTALMFALALSLLLTRRPGLNVVLRTLAAGMLVPTIAVVVVCLGAQVLSVSASPVTLPVIAAIVALVLPSTTLIRDALRRNSLPAPAAGAARAAIEASALLTGAIATALALGREAAGLGTTFLVLVILGVGSVASAAFTGRRYGWWVAGAAFTGALWCVWAMAGVDLLEAYLLPPALGSALVAVVLTLRGAPARGLYAAGLGVAVLPVLALLALVEPDARTAVEVPWRAVALLAGAAVLCALGGAFARTGRGRALAVPTFAAAGLAAVAGPVQGARFGLGADLVALHGAPLFLACLGVSVVGAVLLALAARGIRRSSAADSRMCTSRWMYAPAVLALAAGTWCAIERDWFSIWAMWTLMLGVLSVMLVAAVRVRATALPPVWFLFATAFATAVVAWSPRDLRVEWFSLPLGAFLLAAGIAGMRQAGAGAGAGADAGARGTLDGWPGHWRGSWALLAPGIVTMMSASIVATFTDPLTWRAILVMVLALAAILVGAGRRLAAPFLLGMIVLPIENVFAFAVQIGRGIESMPWWITLAVVGAVLLIIAVTYERRSGESGSFTARVRDLR